MEANINNKIFFFDTTLRDGQQTTGVDFSVEDKMKFSKALSELGVDYIEGGWPGSNPTDDAFFNQSLKLDKSKLVAFGMTRRPSTSVENDPGLNTLVNTKLNTICIVGKSSSYQVEKALEISLDDNLKMISDSIAYLVSKNIEALYDAEHFFDGYKLDPDYALKCLEVALKAGARWIVLCDTNGGTLPNEVYDIVKKVAEVIPSKNIGIHAHNDTENAVANSLAAIISGVRHVQGTLNGLGERCGNANLVSIIPTLLFKKYFKDRFTTSVNEEKIAYLTDCSRLLDEILNRKPNNRAAYVGSSAFAHKGGLHVSAVQKDPKTYEHIDPALVGNNRTVVISDQAGRSNIISRLEKLKITVDSKDPKIQKILDEVKDREFSGYSYDGADASFELLTRRLLGQVPNYIQIKNYEVSVVKNEGTSADLNSKAKATLIVDGKEIVCEGIGNGPVNALDQAIRNNLENIGKYSEYLKDLKLIDYKVRILNTGTNAMTRVLIESSDKSNENWFTIGVSPNIIEASFRALIDSIDYKLYKSQAPENSK